MDWYDKAYKELIEDIQYSTGLTADAIMRVYSYLSNVGLIDYDIEKEFLYNTYVEGESDE